MRVLALTIAVALALLGANPARAESSCWSRAELQAYDITMQTLMLAHVAADCDAAAKADPPLRTRLSQFLGQNGKALDADRQALSQYFHRAYVDDWEVPLQNSLDREEKRVGIQVKQNATPEFCEGASKALQDLGSQSWDQFVQAAKAADWHDKAGLPACQ
jgi:hypothetical protein